MEKFIRELRNKPHSYKKRFAFFTSSSVTMLMFVVWSLASFGVPEGAERVASVQEKRMATVAVSQDKSSTPFENLREGIAGAIGAAGPYLKETGSSIIQSDLETSYREMRNSAFEKYGR